MATTQGLPAAADDMGKAATAPAYGITQIDGQPATTLRFVRTEKDGHLTHTVSFHMGNKQVARIKDLDRDGLVHALGDKNAKTVLEHTQDKGAIRGEGLHNEYGLSPREFARREAMRQNQLADMEAEAQVRDAANEINKIERTPVRQREHEQWLADQERLGLQAEDRRIRIENLSEKAQEQRDANLLAERTGGDTDYDNQQLTEREKNRQAQLMDLLHQQFRVSGAKFHFKDQPQKVAFTDKGNRIVSASNDERVVKAMATMVQAKGWKTITVSGHPDFRREIWMQASLQGIEVRGYKPKEQEMRLLEEQRERQIKNRVKHDSARDRQKIDRMRANERNKEHRRKEAIDAEKRRQETERGTGSATAALVATKAAVAALGVHAGKVTGTKPIETLHNSWDVSKTERYRIIQAVASAVINAKTQNPAQQQALRQAIDARLQERAQAGKLPAVAIYDKAAPSQERHTERARPVVERHAEQTR